METKVMVTGLLEAYKEEVISFMQQEYNISEKESIGIIEKTGFEKSFLASHQQFNAMEPSKIAKIAYEYWGNDKKDL